MAKRVRNNKPGAAATAPPAPEAAPPPATAASRSAKNPAAVQLGRLGGKKGGPARARKLTKQQRSEIARKAAQARWAERRRG